MGALDRPWKGADERHDQVDEGPSNDNVVIGDDAERCKNGSETDTGKTGVDSTEHTDVTSLEFLTKRELHECYGDTNAEEADPVGDKEEGTTPLIAQVGETPEVSKTDTVADHGEDEGGATEPSGSFRAFISISEDVEEFIFARKITLLDHLKV